MSSLLIRDVPAETLSALKHLAERHNRSLHGELRAILDHAARMAPAGRPPRRFSLHMARTGNVSPVTREQIYRDDAR